MKWKLIVSIIFLITIGNGGCWGYWMSGGPKRGTLEKNKFNKHPYRQCVDEHFPHQDTEQRSHG